MQFFLPTLNGGEVSDLLAGRGDFKQRQYGGSTVENFIPLVQGPIVGRPGTKYISSVYNASNRTHLIGMDTASQGSYIVEASEYVFRFFKSGALLTGSTQAITSWGGSATVTFSGTAVTWTAHGLVVNSSVKFTTTGALPAEITSGTIYYVTSVTTNTFTISTLPGGTAITFSGGGTPTHTGYHNIVKTTAENSFNENDIVRISGATGVTPINGDYAVKNNTGSYSSVTITNASPGVVTWTGHGLAAGDRVIFRTSGSLPNPLTAGTTYYVKTVLTTDTFTVAAYNSSTVIATTSTGSGSHGAHSPDNTSRFEIHTVDGDDDFLSGDIDVSSYTAAAGSPVVGFIGKMHPYSSSDMFDSSKFNIGIAVIGDTIFMSNSNHWPRKLRVSSDYAWYFTRHEYGSWVDTSGVKHSFFRDGPYQGGNTSLSNLVTVAGSTAIDSAMTLTFSSSQLETEDIGNIIRVVPSGTNAVYGQITSVSSGVSGSALRKTSSGNSTLVDDWRFGLFHTSVGFPHKVAFHQDRIFFLGMDSYATKICSSQTSIYDNFGPTKNFKAEVTDDSAINLDIPSNGTGLIRWAQGSDQSLLVATQNALFSLTGTDSSIFAPGKIQSNSVSSFGAENIPPIIAGSNIYYIENGGTKLRHAGSASNSSFESIDVTRTNPTVLESGAIGMVFSKTPYPNAWIWRNDGVAVSVTIDDNDNVFAFARHILGGSFNGGDAVIESIAVINSGSFSNEVWMVVKRTINSSTVRYLERLTESFYAEDVDQDEAVCVDCAYINTSLSATNVPSGALNHLIGESVWVVADGKMISGKTVNGSGQLDTALSSSATKIIVGLSYMPKFETTDLQLFGDQGHSFGLRKRINTCDVGFYRTLGAKIGRDSSNLNQIDFGEYTTSMGTLFTGVKKEQLNGIHGNTARVRIEQLIPAPICVTFLNAEGEVYG